MSSPLSHIALIGCGFTGTSALFQLVDRFPVKRITVFEASGDFGPGYPYKTEECPDYLINNTTDTMCLAPGNRRAFLNWLEQQPDFGAGTDPQGHLPRAVYGRFLKDVFQSARTLAAIKGITVDAVPAEVTALKEGPDGKVHVRWSGGAMSADAALMTTGRCPGVDSYPHPPTGAAVRYIPDHVMTRDFQDIPLDACIHVLGASLSAYDVLNRVFSPDTGCTFVRDSGGDLVFRPGENQRRLVLLSRSGRLKHMQSRAPMKLDRSHFKLQALRAAASAKGASLKQAADAIRKEADTHGVDIDWAALADPYAGCSSQEAMNDRALSLLSEAVSDAKEGTNFLVDLFQDAQFEIWAAFADQLLDLESEQVYRTTYETAMLSYVAPCPIPTAEKLLALMRAGRVSILKGVSEVRLNDSADFYEIMHQFGTEEARILVNTTGAVNRDVRSPDQPALIRNLHEAGLMHPYQREGVILKGAAVDLSSFRLPATRNIYLANMLLWGPGFFTSSAHLMASIVERILEGLYAER